jgi:hypothetical protein
METEHTATAGYNTKKKIVTNRNGFNYLLDDLVCRERDIVQLISRT